MKHPFAGWVRLCFIYSSLWVCNVVMVLPWCPRGGSPPPSSPAAYSKSSPRSFPPEASALSPAGVSSPAESRSFWAACCCADGSEAAGPLQTSSACSLIRGEEKQEKYMWAQWILVSDVLGVLILYMSHLLALYEAWPVHLPTSAPLGLQLYHHGRAEWKNKKSNSTDESRFSIKNGTAAPMTRSRALCPCYKA